jgi:DNA-binding transcriptional LysR family regulator
LWVSGSGCHPIRLREWDASFALRCCCASGVWWAAFLLWIGATPKALCGITVAEHLSFYRAARALGTNQSSVSTRIKTLEQDLGVILFDRNTRGVRLTEAGRRFVDQVHDAMGILDRAIKTAGMQTRGEEGELRIGVHALTPGCFLDRLLERFHADRPGVRLHITEGTARDG